MEEIPKTSPLYFLGKPIRFKEGKIVSLVPSLTELLYYLGLGEFVVGVTRYCIHPPEALFKSTVLAGTKNFSVKELLATGAHWVLTNREENPKDRVEKIIDHLPVVLTEINKPDDLIPLLHWLSKQYPQCKPIAQTLEQSIIGLPNELGGLGNGRVLYLIWNKPIMAVGGDTFISTMLNMAGYKNATGHLKRYPAIEPQQLISFKPDFLFLSSEPYPFKDEHIAYFKSLLPETQVLLVDGEPFSWYGNRVLNLPAYLKTLHLSPISG